MTRVKQHGFVITLTDGRQVRFIALSKEDAPDEVPCFKCGDVCLRLTHTEDGTGYDVEKPLHPTADAQQHCEGCCQGCKINRRRDVIL